MIYWHKRDVQKKKTCEGQGGGNDLLHGLKEKCFYFYLYKILTVLCKRRGAFWNTT